MDNPPSATPPPVSPQPSSGLTEKQWAVFTHLSAFATFVIPTLGNILGPLILWIIKKDSSAYLDRVGREVLNFQISFTIYMWIASALILALGLGLLLMPVVAVLWLVFTIMGAVKAGNGEDYKFPMTIKML